MSHHHYDDNYLYVTRGELRGAVHEINERITQMGTSEQDQITAITAELTTQNTALVQVATDAGAADTKIQAEVDSLQALITAGQPVTQASIDALKAAADANSTALAPLDGVVTALGNVVPTPPTPPAV